MSRIVVAIFSILLVCSFAGTACAQGKPDKKHHVKKVKKVKKPHHRHHSR